MLRSGCGAARSISAAQVLRVPSMVRLDDPMVVEPAAVAELAN